MKPIPSMAIAPFAFLLAGCTNGANGAKAPLAASPDAGDDGAATSGDDGGSATIDYEATLSGAQVAPTPVQTSASGKGTFTLSSDGTTLAYRIVFAQPDFMPTAVNLHLGAVGQSTNVTHQLMPLGNPMSGQIPLTVDEQTAIVGDQLYVDVATLNHPGGEVRGQLVLPGSEIFVATPTGAQQVPAVMTAYAARASFILTPDQGSLIYYVDTGATPSDLRLHRGIGSINGPVAYDLPINNLPAEGTLQIGGAGGANDANDLENGRFYLNIVTQQNPAGELRGQLLQPAETLFTGVLSGANEVPPVMTTASGGCQLILSADQSTLKYEAVVSGVIAIAAELDRGLPGQNGSSMRQLTLGQSGAVGSTNMAPDDVQGLMTGSVYLNVKTPSFTNGELRAQLARQ
jgi:hypothetical protein